MNSDPRLFRELGDLGGQRAVADDLDAKVRRELQRPPAGLAEYLEAVPLLQAAGEADHERRSGFTLQPRRNLRRVDRIGNDVDLRLAASLGREQCREFL